MIRTFRGVMLFSFCLFILDACKTDPSAKVVIDVKDRKQVVRNFGASDAWACQFAGLWPDPKRNQIADWLFSTELDDKGQPRGIGLSLWRFNIGAGSDKQNNINDPWRRAQGFLTKDLTYDWTQQAGQRWFLEAAEKRGVDKFLAFTNSPPVQLTKNGNAFSSDGERANLPQKNYVPFAKFLVEVLKHLDDEGKAFDYISPFNEPQWDWTSPGQEGTPFTNEEIFHVTKALDSLLTLNKVAAKIQIAEAAVLIYLYEKADKPSRGDQIHTFFDKKSPFYLGDLSHVDKVISGHSYFTTAGVDTLRMVRSAVAEHVKASLTPIEFWQSEYCILGDKEQIKPSGKDRGIDPALYVARIIHHDLTLANASAWHWWLAVSPYDFKDGLIYIDKNETDGKVEDTKLLWALGNYSRFIRPGSTRVGVSSKELNIDNPLGLMVSSYVNDTSGELTVVILNYGESDEQFSLETTDKAYSTFTRYVTSAGIGENLKSSGEITISDVFQIPKRSVVTFVSKVVR